MFEFTEEDKEWFQLAKDNPSEYQKIIDNDSVCIETDNENSETVCVYTFNTYSYEFIYGLLKHLNINVDFC